MTSPSVVMKFFISLAVKPFASCKQILHISMHASASTAYPFPLQGSAAVYSLESSLRAGARRRKTYHWLAKISRNWYPKFRDLLTNCTWANDWRKPERCSGIAVSWSQYLSIYGVVTGDTYAYISYMAGQKHLKKYVCTCDFAKQGRLCHFKSLVNTLKMWSL